MNNSLRKALEATWHSLKDVTVLAAQNDPFRLDTPAGHRDGQWLADMFAKFNLRGKHNRGIHYALLGQKKPDGLPYTGDDWKWLAGPIDAARWLGYIPFDDIVDERNLPPVIRLWKPSIPTARLDPGNLVMPDIPSEIRPSPVLFGMHGKQPYHLVIFGEKSSLSPILTEIADQFQADLFLPTGEISETMVYQMAKSSEVDRRPMIVFTISDCDPAGWQMPVSIARKLQAHKAAHFPNLDFQVRRPALMPSHVRTFHLPGSPLKETERRGDKWRQRIGLEQTEIDAMVTLHPDELREIIIKSMNRFFDGTLALRVKQAKEQWLAKAQTIIDQHMDKDALESTNKRLAKLKDHIEAEIAEINTMASQVLPEDAEDELPEIKVPKAIDKSEDAPNPLIDSGWDFANQCMRLIYSKQYRKPPDPEYPDAPGNFSNEPRSC